MVQTTSAIINASPRRHHSCARDSYIRASPKPNDLYYELPGMAEKMGSKDMTRYSFGQSPSNRDSFVKAGRKCLDVTYEVPGMADAIKRDPRGSYAFKNSGPGDRMTYITKHMKEVIRREPHKVPDMAEAIALSPKGTAAFRQSSARDSYIRASPKPNDLYYELPGMAEKMGSKDMTRYSFGQSPSNRDSFVKAGRKCLDVTYEVPGMADAIKRDPRGSYAFKNSGPGDRMTYITKHMKEVIRREPHVIAGMADNLHQKHYGAFHACCPDCTANRAQSAPRRRAASASAIERRHTVPLTNSPLHSFNEQKKLAVPLFIPTNSSLAAIEYTHQPLRSPSVHAHTTPSLRSYTNGYTNPNSPSKHADPLFLSVNASINSGGGLTDNQSFAIV